jgi:hypothetical protein
LCTPGVFLSLEHITQIADGLEYLLSEWIVQLHDENLRDPKLLHFRKTKSRPAISLETSAFKFEDKVGQKSKLRNVSMLAERK